MYCPLPSETQDCPVLNSTIPPTVAYQQMSKQIAMMLLLACLFAIPASGVLYTFLAPPIGGLQMEALALMDALDDPVDPGGVSSVHFVGDGLSPSSIFHVSPQTSPRFRYMSTRRRRGAPPSPSPSSSSSSVASDNDVPDAVPPAQVDVEAPDPTPVEDRVDGQHRAAAQADQRTVYMWTFAHTTMANHARPEEFSRASFLQAVVGAYEATGKVVLQACCFQETHPESKSEREQHMHYHVIVETDTACRWAEVANYLRKTHRVFASAATSSARKSYWAAFAYLFAPSARKPKDDLDAKYVLSPGHEEPPQQLVNRRVGIRRLPPLEIFSTIINHGLDTLLKLYGFAARQHSAGDHAWLQHIMRSPERKLVEEMNKALAMSSAEGRLARCRLTHIEVLRSALTSECCCEGHAIAGWEKILTNQGISVADYRASVLRLFEGGGGKGLNHLYIGEPSSGKTGLTKPLLALFREYAFLKPQVGTTFALSGLIGAQAVIWNDMRWPHPPLAWNDLLNLFDNEPFKVGFPKVDGQTDVDWNTNGDSNVIAVLTSNAEIVYVTGDTINPIETAAWLERFGLVLRFQTRLANPDKRYKKWFKCTCHYASWILGEPVPGATATLATTPLASQDTKRTRTGPGPRSGGAPTPDVSLPAAMPAVPPFPSGAPAQEEEDWDYDPFGHNDVTLPLATAAAQPADVSNTGASSEPSSSAQPENVGSAAASSQPCLPAQPEDGGSAAAASQPSLPDPRPKPDTTEPLRDLNLYLSRAGAQLQVRAENYIA
jgi:hypothetical protein